MSLDRKHIDAIQAQYVVVHGPQTIIAGGLPIDLPGRAELLAYAAYVQAAYSRWADRPDIPDPPLAAQPPADDGGPDDYIDIQARPLPMRVSVFRAQPAAGDPPVQDLVAALAGLPRTVLLGEPGSGKTTALERLAWVTAMDALNVVAGESTPLTLPVLARLADYQGEADLVPLLRRSLNRSGALQINDDSVRLLLWARNVRCVLLLDGFNEFGRAYRERGRGALRRHLDDYPDHAVHLTCRTADFDLAAESDPAVRVLPGAHLWEVQPLLDEIRYWDDGTGRSDVRDYLRLHLGHATGKRLYERLQADERLASLARLPLFLWMIKETASGDPATDGRGDLPSDRGGLLRRFVRAPRLLGRVPADLRNAAERSLEALGWRMQVAGSLELPADALYAELAAVRGPRSYDLDEVRRHLQDIGLLVAVDEARRPRQDSGLPIAVGDARYRLLHQLVQEYAAAAHLAQQPGCAEDLPVRARDAWWRESCIAALWLRRDLHTPDYLQQLMGEPAVDLRVRVAAATVLAAVGDPRFQSRPYGHRGRTVQAMAPQRMVTVPAGDAVLGGADPEAFDDELPECRVDVAAFELAVFPVTNAEYACFMDGGGYDDRELWTPAGRAWLAGEGKLDLETDALYRRLYQAIAGDVEGYLANMKQQVAVDEETADSYRQVASSWTEDEFVDAYASQILGEQRRSPVFWGDSRFNQANQPVVGVNWYEAMAYAAWLAQVTGRPYHLPSEAEWEWAARRATRRYPWPGDWDPDRCNWSGSRLNRPSPVGVFPHGATPDGLHDLAGNVYEWTATLYRRYRYDPADGREDPHADGLRVVRGGSWYTGKERVRCAYRDGDVPRRWDNFLGMRLARTLS